MAELKQEDVVKVPILSIKDWAKQYGGGVSHAAVSYLIDNDIIDHIWVGHVRVVVLSDKTLEYVPNQSKVRKSIMRL